MQNYFFTFLPDDIQNYIFQLRLSMQLEKNYFRKSAQKQALMKYIIENNHYGGLYPSHSTYTNIFSRNTENYNYTTYLDPYNIKTKFLANKLSNVLTNNDEKIWWISQFIRPLERGLIIYKDWYKYVHPAFQYNFCFYKTEISYYNLMKKLDIKHNPLIFTI